MALQIARDCERARGKDEERGARIIDDYAEVHPAAVQDRVVRLAQDEADRLRDEVMDELLAAPSVEAAGPVETLVVGYRR